MSLYHACLKYGNYFCLLSKEYPSEGTKEHEVTDMFSPTRTTGMGLSYANGIALAARMDDLKFNVYVLLGDGELQEGQVWEAAMTSSHYGLDNVCVVIDRNRFQSQGEKVRNIQRYILGRFLQLGERGFSQL